MVRFLKVSILLIVCAIGLQAQGSSQSYRSMRNDTVRAYKDSAVKVLSPMVWGPGGLSVTIPSGPIQPDSAIWAKQWWVNYLLGSHVLYSDSAGGKQFATWEYVRLHGGGADSSVFATQADLRDSLAKVLKIRDSSIYTTKPLFADSISKVLKLRDSTIYTTKPLWADSLSKLVRLRDTNSVFYSYARTRDSLAALRSAIGSGGGNMSKSDSTTMPGYVTRTMIVTDSTNRNVLLGLKVAKSDSSAMPGYVTRSQILTDSTNRNVLIAKKVAIADSATYPGYVSLTAGATRVAKADSSTMPGYVTRTQMVTDTTNRNVLLGLKVARSDSTTMPGYITRTQFVADTNRNQNIDTSRTNAVSQVVSQNTFLTVAASNGKTARLTIDSTKWATSALSGFLKFSDWVTFNGKQPTLFSRSGGTISASTSTDTIGASTNYHAGHGSTLTDIPIFSRSNSTISTRGATDTLSIAHLKVGTNGVVVDSVKKPATGSSYEAVYIGGTAYYAKNDTTSAAGGATDSIKVKGSDETDTGTSLQDDDDLHFGIGTNQTWIGNAFLDCHAQNGTDGEGIDNNGIKFAINGPSGTTLTFEVSCQYQNNNYAVAVYHYLATKQTALNTEAWAAFQSTTPGVAGNADKIVHITFLVKSSSTAGTISLRWYPIAGIDDPATQSATIRARSYLYARKAN